nr:transposase, MuDR, MULE transposase domain protein [Tanacetum cinerariifolium]
MEDKQTQGSAYGQRSESVIMSEEAEVSRTKVPVSKKAGRIEEHVVEHVIDGSSAEDVKHDEENKIVEPDVDVHLFGISKDVYFDNIGVTNLVSDDVLAGDDVDVVNPDKVNIEISIKAVQDQLQRELELHVLMSKALRAKAKAEREVKGHHVLQYAMLRDYVVEFQSTNPNTTIKITVERNTYPSFPTRVFKRVYVCLGALKMGFKAYKRELLGLDGVFMKGPFLDQV